MRQHWSNFKRTGKYLVQVYISRQYVISRLSTVSKSWLCHFYIHVPKTFEKGQRDPRYSIINNLFNVHGYRTVNRDTHRPISRFV